MKFFWVSLADLAEGRQLTWSDLLQNRPSPSSHWIR
jgi:predicted DNA-binding ribbon-helix-helix protein